MLLLFRMLKTIVSKKKKRFQEDGFDLDLSYIGDNLIAMGFPGEKMEAFYRNDIDEVTRFLESRHKGKYKIYNLCERSYNTKKFNDRVARFPFKDHNPPNLNIIPQFCKDVHEWLSSHPQNIAVVHCKAGKGRTGVMICCYLLHSKLVSTAQDALTYYANMRTHNCKGVTIPSQRRYVEYYEYLLSNPSLNYVTRPVLLDEISILGASNISSSSNLLFVTITQSGTSNSSFTSPPSGIEFNKSTKNLNIELDEALELSGDVKFELHVKHLMKNFKLCHFWINSFFISKSSTSHSHPPPDCRTRVRFVSRKKGREKELERTMSCPPESDTKRSPLPPSWAPLHLKFDEEPDDGDKNSKKEGEEDFKYLILNESDVDKLSSHLVKGPLSIRLKIREIFPPPILPQRPFRSHSDSTSTSPLLQKSSQNKKLNKQLTQLSQMENEEKRGGEKEEGNFRYLNSSPSPSSSSTSSSSSCTDSDE